jgi:taurine dioxygenase
MAHVDREAGEGPAVEEPTVKAASRTLSQEQIRPFGYRVDVDLGDQLSGSEQDALRSMLHQDGLLIFHDQHLNIDQQTRVMAHFGKVGNPKDSVSVVSVKPPENGAQRGTLEDIELPWHMDGAFLPLPYPALSLHALEVVDGETSTFFASGAEAYATLPDELKHRIVGMRALHALPVHPERRFRKDDLQEAGDGWPAGAHPIVRTHRVGGRPYLYINWQHTVRVEGLEHEESEALLQELFRAYYDPKNVVEHVWRNGDLVVWDNLMINHRRSDLKGVTTRTLQRVQLIDKTFAESFPDFVPRGEYLKKLFGSYKAPGAASGS